ncbi:DNA-binding response regulator [Streptomyces sp. NPDC001262]|uniref:response regulator transcription factor n=1 Tax=Streptomyces TaxID=1883 RepID=UPI0036A534FC
MLASQADIRVLGEAGDPASARPVPGLRRPDVLLVFLDSAEREEIAVLDGVRRTFGRRPVLLVIRSLSPGGARRALAADPAGVVTEDASPQTLIEAIKHVKNGRRAVAPDVALLASASTPSPFTPRETEILALAAEGEGPAETARRLHLSAGTVRNHLLSAVQKTGARNRLDAIRIARRKGWL